MARVAKMSESPAPFRDDLYEASPPPARSRRNNTAQGHSPSPPTSISSDKENRSSRQPVDKVKGRAPMGMGPPPRVSSPSDRNKRKRGTDEPLSDRSNSRRRTLDPEEGNAGSNNSRRRRTVNVQQDSDEEDGEGEEEEEDNQIRVRSNRRLQTVEVDEDGTDDCNYDPDQDIHERRKLRKKFRDLDKNLRDNRTEFLLPNSTGLRDTLIAANELSAQVKQTSDATIDAKLLSTAADYSLKKTIALISGDTAQGIDIDDFLSKIKQFMRRGDDADQAPSSTQVVRRDDGEEDDDMLNWAYLGRNACIMHNARPSVPGFLLGPLSVEKRAKRVVVRKATLKHTQLEETRPETLKAGDVKRDKNQNLSDLCTQIRTTFHKIRAKNYQAVQNRADDTEDGQALLDRYDISSDAGLSLFKFVINPWSFGQTVENMFYVSFLIRDGALGISTDERGLPYLDEIDEGDRKAAVRGEHPKHQAILSLDMATWEELIDAFDIKEPMIRHREEEQYTNVGAKGWYA